MSCDVLLNENYLYDLSLQCLFSAQSVPIHLPYVLFHLHDPLNIVTVTANDALNAAWVERCQVLERHFKRHQMDVTIRRGNFFPITHVLPVWDESPLVSIIIPFRDRADLLETCIMSILEKTSYHRFEIVGVDNRSQTPEIKALKADLIRNHARIQFHDYDEPFNYAAINNRAVESWCQGEFIVLLNNDIEIISPDWIERLLDHARRPGVGIVGAKLYYPSGEIQHAGVGLGVNDLVAHLHRGYPSDAPGYLYEPHIVHNVSAVTAACLMIRRLLYQEVGGMDAVHLKVAFNDVDLCLRLRARGFKIIYTPLCQASHHESVTRKIPSTPEAKAQFQSEVAFMQRAHRRLITDGDPFYNPNLARHLNTPTADVAILTIRMKSGYGVDVVVDVQACELVQAGYKVTVYAIDCDTERFAERPYYLVRINSGKLDTFVARLNTSPHTYIIAHSTPFFEILPRIDKRKVTIAYEHGDPNPDLFDTHERETRLAIKAYKHDVVYGSCNAVVAISRFIRRDIDWPDAVVIHNGADHLQNRCPPADDGEPSPAFSSSKINILCVSRLGCGECNYKGYDQFIAFSDLIDTDRFTCVLLGAGTRADKRAIERAGIKVILNASDRELVRSYLACDVFISFSKWEGFNLPLVEAQYFGKPALALDHSSHREVTPLVFDSLDQMAQFLSGCSHEDLVAYGRRAKEFVGQYLWSSNVAQLRQLMHGLISGFDFYAAADGTPEAPQTRTRFARRRASTIREGYRFVSSPKTKSISFDPASSR
ncbi:glycosyltransferase [Desulfosarcina cetonica]|uniref:glycosyltransferase n=1 Tax=Desulfosarcina cetonica TaxID=90730 RepID=UPI0012EE1691|nr:glycosyltransferase [Desulfosarcina cetonica]